MSEAFKPVLTLDDLDALDGTEVQEGYFDGRDDAPEPRAGGNRSRSYWHGWHVGMCDAGRLEPSAGHRKLIAMWLERVRLTRQLVG